MPLLWRQSVKDESRCPFCRKRKDAVGELISNPSDYPRAYICDECVAVCASIREDRVDPFAGNPFASEFFALVEEWITRMRTLARHMFVEPQPLS